MAGGGGERFGLTSVKLELHATQHQAWIYGAEFSSHRFNYTVVELPARPIAGLAIGLRCTLHLERFTGYIVVWRSRAHAPRVDAGAYAGPSGGFSPTGSIMRNTAPRGWFGVAQSRPPCASTIERQINSPMPKPPGLVV